MVQLSRPGWRVGAVTASLLAGLVSLPAAPAVAHQNRPGATPKVVASGLNNPRQITYANGALYVAESGTGGSGACVKTAEGRACYGASGSITRVSQHGQRRVVTGLPSIAAPGGSATGPSDVIVHGRKFQVSLGLGADPGVRAALPANGKKLGTVAAGRFGRSGLKVVADIGAYEGRANPDKSEPDTNPVSLLEARHRTYVVDAGGNTLLSFSRRGRISTRAVFPATQAVGPSGAPIPMQAVPTAAAFGPDGAIYVSQLTGFPFPVGGANIWRVVPGHAPTRYATGLTNVTDLAFGKDGSLYAVQLADEGLLAPKPTGSVVRIPRGGGARHVTVADNLKAPYGIAVHHGSAYVTTCSTCAGAGEVLRVPLPHRR